MNVEAVKRALSIVGMSARGHYLAIIVAATLDERGLFDRDFDAWRRISFWEPSDLEAAWDELVESLWVGWSGGTLASGVQRWFFLHPVLAAQVQS